MLVGGWGEGGGGGWFNAIRRISKKLGGLRLTPNMRVFLMNSQESELIDPSLSNLSFTWSNMQDLLVYKR